VITTENLRLGLVVILAAAAQMMAGGCGNAEPSAAELAEQRVVSSRLDEVEKLDVFRETPAFATPVGEDRRYECHEPEFERREPASWRELQFEGTPDEVLSYYRTRLTQDGWRLTREIANQGQLPTIRFEKPLDGWVAAFSITVITAESIYEIGAEDATSRVCPTS
jgi:hypothetical protein